MNRRRSAVLAAGGLVLLVLVVGAVLWQPLAWIGLGLLQLAVLLVVVDSRRALSARIFASSAKLERRLSGLSRGGKGSGKPAGRADQHQADVREILTSRVFDVEWYEAQLDAEFEDAASAVSHYLKRGRRAGATPHPLFDPAWIYPNAWRSMPEDPLLRYLRNRDDAWALQTSAHFDPARLDESLPTSEHGPLAAFVLHRGSDHPLPIDQELPGVPAGLTLSALRDLLAESSRAWRRREELTGVLRGRPEPPEHDSELDSLRDGFRSTGRQPMVSVVLPTWNRARTLQDAIASVQAQSYGNWQLVIADDGSVDDTALVLAAESAREPRIAVLNLPHRGVSAARNAALAAATGEYVAFLDSDKEWDPEFLLTMVAFLEAEQAEAAYAITEVTVGGKTTFFSVPATRESLLANNSVDQTALVATREVIERAGRFDETLKRAVDYDLILSISETTPLRMVPFVGVRYSEDVQDPHRISEAQSVAWNHHVRKKHILREWAPTESTPGLLTVVIDGVSTQRELHAALGEARVLAKGIPHEIIVSAANDEWILARAFDVAAVASEAPLAFIPGTIGGSAPLRVDEALRRARGEHVLVMGARHAALDVDLKAMIGRMTEKGAAASHPVVLDDKYLVHDAGVVFGPRCSDPVPYLKGLPREWPRWTSALVPLPAAPWPLLMRSDAVQAAGGMDARLTGLWADVDLSRRIASEVGSVLLDTRTAFQAREVASANDPSTEIAADVRMIHDLWDGPPPGTESLLAAAGVDADFHGSRAISVPEEPGRWTTATWRPRPLLSVREGVPRLRWAIKTAAPAHAGSSNWGDLHFGRSLATALEELGQSAVVDYGPNAARATADLDDVVLTLRGLDPIPLPVGATSVIWVISHPDEVAATELSGYDLSYAASTTWPATMLSQCGLRVEPLLQCTDPHRFHIDAPAPEIEGELLMVGNSRHQYRPAAWHTANAGMPVAIYGTDWEDKVPAEAIRGDYLPNEELRRYYRGARWALNDHWPDMREQGFVSNRIFDVLASGGRLLTDDVTGLDEILPEGILPHGIATFRSPAELLDIAKKGPEHFYDEESLQAASAHVLRHHSFRARAEVMLDAVLRRRTDG